MRPFVWMFALALGCKDTSAVAPEAAASAQPSASAGASGADFDSHGTWWAVAAKSHVYTPERRQDADNAIRLLRDPARTRVVKALDDMATQKHNGDGLDAASQLARDGQERVEDANNPAAKNALTGAAWMVLSGLIALTCDEHPDRAALADLLAAIREMPLPHLDKGNGNPERLVLEQEMKASVPDDKLMKSLLAAAPPPKKSL